MKIVKIFLIGILAIIILLVSYFTIRYFTWRNTFFNDSENTTCTNDEDYEQEDINIFDRIENFVLSKDRTEFMTFTRKELLFVLRDSFKDNDTLKIQDMCLSSQRGMWRVYMHPKIEFLQLPWIGVDIMKDEMQTAEVYSRGMYVGDMKVPTSIAKKSIEQVNRGISDALILVTENGFLGKTIRNIDLLKDSIVIKGGF